MKTIGTIIFVFLFTYAFTQDSLIDENEIGRYINVSTTNYEVRAINLTEQYLIMESINGTKLSFEVIERDKSIIKTKCEDRIMFFELKHGKIIVYQRTKYSNPTISAYKNGENDLKNVFRKISY